MRSRPYGRLLFLSDGLEDEIVRKENSSRLINTQINLGEEK
jgi:hypothetical protein